MSQIAIRDGAIEIDASIVARGLGLEPSLVQAMMRKGEITGLCERGRERGCGALSADFLPHEPAFSRDRRRDGNRHPALDH
jgi:Family of unknown function (DUF6522)